MMRLRILISIGCLLALAVAAVAQTPTPVPAPAPPSPPALRIGISDAIVNTLALEEKAQALEAQERILEKRLAAGLTSQDAQQKMMNQMMNLKEELSNLRLAQSSLAAQPLENQRRQPQFKFPQVAEEMAGPYAADVLYERGQSALDRHRWDEALEAFTQAVSKGGGRADGALYWKAYALNKLGRRDDALAAIAELRKSYSVSRWLDDAKALELEVKQANGQPVSPESQTDEDLKLMALNGLMDSDPERAIPAVEDLLKGAQTPRLKDRALYVLAQSSSPKAQQLVEQVARGGAGNPDLQVKAITYLGAANRRFGTTGAFLGGAAVQSRPRNGQLFSEIYNWSDDVNVKRAILNALSATRDSDRLLQIAKTEKTPELRADAVRRLLQLRMPDLAALMTIYNADQDKGVKRAIVEGFYSQGNVKAMVAAARAERDPEMVRFIVGRLASMKSPEAADYLMEILKK